jgi:hypothetical protein
MEDGMLNRVTFIPWGAVLSIRGTTEQERAEGGGEAHPRAGSRARPARKRLSLATIHRAIQGTLSQFLIPPLPRSREFSEASIVPVLYGKR